MKPVAIFRHLPIEGPGYFATFLDNNHIPWRLIKIDAGEKPPTSIAEFSGLVFMGGPMSVNDDLPWIENSLTLIRQADTDDVPVLGHCLGGQLMAKALWGYRQRQSGQGNGLGRSQRAGQSGSTRMVWRFNNLQFFSLARRSIQHPARRYLHPVQSVLRESGVCAGHALRHAMPRRNDRAPGH